MLIEMGMDKLIPQADLTQAVEQLRETGVATIDQFLNPQELNEIRSETEQLIQKAIDSFKQNQSIDEVSTFVTGEKQVIDQYFLDSVDRVSYFYEDKLDENGLPSINKIGHALHHRHDYFRKLCFSPKIKQVARALDMKRPVLPQSMLILKNAKVGGKVIAHKDASFLYTEPTTRLVGLWIPLEDCDRQNGCLWYVPGSHQDLRCRRYARKDSLAPEVLNQLNDQTDSLGVFMNQDREPEFPPEAFVPLELKAGTCVLLDGYVVHKSEENNSHRSRHAFTMHFLDIPAEIQWSNSNWLRPNQNYQFPTIFDN